MIAEIRKYGKIAGYNSLNKIEIAAGIPLNSIYKWDGNSPSIDRVIKVARVLGISIDALVGYEIEKSDSLGLSEDERDVIRLYRNASQQTRSAMLHFLQSLEADAQLRDASTTE